MAKVEGNTAVTINDGHLGADVFGGGEGTLKNDGTVSMSADVSGETYVTINGGEFAVAYDNSKPQPYPFKEHYNIYGGGNIASQVGETHVYVTKGMVSNASDGSDSFLDNSRIDRNEAGMAQAYYHEGQMYFCIFGGGYGKNTSVTGDTWVDFNITGMTDINSTAIEDDLLEYQSYLDVIGGGFNGTVGGNTNVHVGGNAMCRNVYGGGLYATIGNKGRGETGKTNVHITGGNIDNVYGGGVMGDIMTSTNVNIGLKSALDFDTHNYTANNDHITILMSVYGANDVSGHVPQANITHNGGTVDQNIYGAGNGDYTGYYTPNLCAYADGENDNYFIVTHAGDDANSGPTYKGRPQTDNVNITMGGNSAEDKAVVLGQVFGGGNSCTVGHWKTDLSSKYDGDPHQWRNDPDFFEGGGTLNITLNSHVAIGQDNENVSSEYQNADGENVSGLYMGASGSVLATQSDAANYHHYYDSSAQAYKAGFSSTDGEDAFKAYLNNILIWSDNVNLTITGTDIWLANFVGGGFRGSMKRKEATNFSWTLPAGVTVGNCIVGGAYNADVKYVNDPLDLHYAGGLLQNNGTTFADVVLNLSNNMNGGEKARVFGGCFTSGTVNNTQIDYYATGAYDVYGGGALANLTGNSVVNLLGGNLTNAYGGGLGRMADAEHDIPAVAALVGGDATVTLNGATADNIFGCNNINGAPQGTVTVTTISGTVNHNVYGGGNQAAASVSPIVNIKGGTITENVYGGGYGATAVITGSPVVTVAGGTVIQDVYGGGSLANTEGSTTITVSGGEVARDVYGGGALANVTGNTIVDLTGGSIGSAYGGGLGSAEVAAYVNGNATVTLGNAGGTAASKVTGSIFGANNVNGTPKGHVKVHVLHTASRDQANRNTAGTPESFDVLAVYGGGNKAAYEPTGAETAVTPADPKKYTKPDHYAEVLIENCDNSIAYVYGGGNAAPVPATEVKIHGANAIDYAFAGGNGQNQGGGSGDNPGADVGYLGYYSTGGATEYGAGTSHIWIYGGTVNNVFGGSNTLGYIRKHAYVDIPEFDGGACLLEVGNVHAGGNKAEMFCGGSMTLACSEGVNTIFAGSNSADIYGDIELNINSGTYSNIFGGNNTSGNVHGSITINIDETGCWPVMIGNLYGCGNQAAYSVYGYNTDQDKTPRTKEQYAALTDQEKEDIKNAHGIAIPYKDPVINVVSCTRIDHIFGGGKGTTATVYGNPTVNINTINGRWAGKTLTPAFVLNDDSQREDNTAEITIPDEPGTIGSIYGGGDAAPVVGNTRVNIGTEATAKHISGSDEMKKEAQPVTVTILGNVFGGSKGLSDNSAAGRVTGTTKVVIGK